MSDEAEVVEYVAQALFEHHAVARPELVPWHDQASWNRNVYYDMARIAIAAMGPQLTAEEARVLLESTDYSVQYGQGYSDLETSEWRDTLEQTKAKLSLIAKGP